MKNKKQNSKTIFIPLTLIYILLFAILFSRASYAEVNMKDASYFKNFRDFSLLDRTYKSRSWHNGIFGYGWCSDFEKSVQISSQKIILKDCQRDENGEFIWNTKSQSYCHIDCGFERIILSKNQYLHFSQNKMISRYDKEGYLISGQKMDGPSFEISYSPDHNIDKISFAHAGQVFRFLIDTNTHKVIAIYDSGGKRTQYRYESQNLVQVKNSWDSVYTFNYDNYHNLTRINYPDSSFEKMTYNEAQDWIISSLGRNKCQELYDYKAQKDDPKNHFVSSLERQCPGQKIQRVSYEFWFKSRHDGQKFLAQVQIRSQKRNLKIQYDPYLGHAVRVSQNGKRILANFN